MAGKGSCKWCATGSCWTHGGTFKKGGNTGVMVPGSQGGAKGGGKRGGGGGGQGDWSGGGGGGGGWAGGGDMSMMGMPGPPPAWMQEMLMKAYTEGAKAGSGGGGGGGGGVGGVKQRTKEQEKKRKKEKKDKKMCSDEKIASMDIEEATEEELEAFLTEHSGVESHAVAKLKECHPKIQKMVLNIGSMEDAKDQTAVLMSRMRQINNMRPGDWCCPGCGDLQFAKNDECRKCGAAQPESLKVEISAESAAKVAALAIEGATESEVDGFLATHEGDFQDHAVAKFKNMDPKLQKIVMDQGSTKDARDQTAVLMSRMRRANEIRPGDWICTGCNDLQFAKNEKCRKCGADKV